MLKNKLLKLINIITSILSIMLAILFIILTPYEDIKVSFWENLSSSQWILILLCSASAIVSIVVSIFSLIHMKKEIREQQKTIDVLLQYNRLANKGDDIYNKELHKLFKQETITSIELKKLQNIHIAINDSEIDRSEEIIKEDIDNIHRVLDKISAEAKDTIS